MSVSNREKISVMPAEEKMQMLVSALHVLRVGDPLRAMIESYLERSFRNVNACAARQRRRA